MALNPQVAHTAKKYTPNMVLNQTGERLIIQSTEAKVIENPNKIIAGPDHFRLAALMAGSPVRSWRKLEDHR